MEPSNLSYRQYNLEQTRLQQIQSFVKSPWTISSSVAAIVLAASAGCQKSLDTEDTKASLSGPGVASVPTKKVSEPQEIQGKKTLQVAVQSQEESLDVIMDSVKDAETNMPKIVVDNQQIFEFLDGYLDENDTYGTMYVKLSQKLQRLALINEQDDTFTKNIRLEMRYRLDNGIVPASELMIQALEQAEYKKTALIKLIEAFQHLSPTVQDMRKMNDLLIIYFTEADGTWNREDWEKWGNAMNEERKGVEKQIEEQRKIFQQNSKPIFDEQNARSSAKN